MTLPHACCTLLVPLSTISQECWPCSLKYVRAMSLRFRKLVVGWPRYVVISARLSSSSLSPKRCSAKSSSQIWVKLSIYIFSAFTKAPIRAEETGLPRPPNSRYPHLMSTSFSAWLLGPDKELLEWLLHDESDRTQQNQDHRV